MARFTCPLAACRLPTAHSHLPKRQGLAKSKYLNLKRSCDEADVHLPNPDRGAGAARGRSDRPWCTDSGRKITPWAGARHGADGTTRLLLTRIPFFREIVIMSFDCPECGFRNSEIQPAGEIQIQGHKYTFRVETDKDVSRQIIKSDTCVFRVEDLDLEVPAGRGQLSNVEGILSSIKADLAEKQEEPLAERG